MAQDNARGKFKTVYGWMAVTPKSYKPWGQPWVYLYKRNARTVRATLRDE